MGRELKRVPLDYPFEIGKKWFGYISPFGKITCPQCRGRGENKQTEALTEEWYGLNLINRNDRWAVNLTQEYVNQLVKHNRLMDFTHRFKSGKGWRQKKYLSDYFWCSKCVTKEIARHGKTKKCPNCGNRMIRLKGDNVLLQAPEAKKVNEWARTGMGHDSINAWICVKHRAKKEGVYGLCPQCNGDGGIYPSDILKEKDKSMKRVDPPKGQGYQLWETTSEGSPITPVFETLEDLCEYCEVEKIPVFGRDTASKKKWMSMLDKDIVFHEEGSMVFL